MTYYVSPNGDDSASGTESDPWRTLVRADGAASPGDMIVLHDGEYAYSSAQRLKTNSVTVRGASGASPTVSFGGTEPGGWGFDDDGAIRVQANDVIVEGIEVRDSPYYGILLGSDADGSTVRNCSTHHNHLVGIGSYQASNLTVENCVSYANNGSTSDGGDSDGIQLRGAEGGTIRGCVSYGNADDGYDLWESKNVLVEKCKSYDNGRAGGDGNGFKMGGGDASGNNTVQRSVAWRNDNIGFTYNAATESVYFYNNTSWNNDQGYWAEDGCVLKNNISYRDGRIRTTANTVEKANTWNLGIDDPGFVSTDPERENFLRPAPDSPAVDAGVDVGLPYSSEAPDLGWAEAAGDSGGPILKYHDGSDWVTAELKYHDGSGFAPASVKLPSRRDTP